MENYLFILDGILCGKLFIYLSSMEFSCEKLFIYPRWNFRVENYLTMEFPHENNFFILEKEK